MTTFNFSENRIRAFKLIRSRIRDHKTELVAAIRKNKAEGYRHCSERLQFRLMHIAYCEFFGKKTREQIEQPKENNALNGYHERQIENIKAGWLSELKASEAENA